MASSRTHMPDLRRVVVAAGVATLAALGISGPASAASIDGETELSFNTRADWDGITYLQPWGHPDTATYGQIITVPDGMHNLRGFRFYTAALGQTGTITYRGEVYGWDGLKATDEVWESERMKIKVTSGSPTVKTLGFRARGAKVVPGEQYVIFASISKDYETTDPNVSSQWALRITDEIPGGYVVFMNDAGNESLWTTQSWETITTYDLALKARFK